MVSKQITFAYTFKACVPMFNTVDIDDNVLSSYIRKGLGPRYQLELCPEQINSAVYSS
jgi:hypothetical protein